MIPTGFIKTIPLQKVRDQKMRALSFKIKSFEANYYTTHLKQFKTI